MLELKGEPSPPETIAYRDVFPPTIPAGLAAIPGGGFGQPVAIDLSWSPSPEQKTRGYNVYRADGDSDAFVRMNERLLAGPAYRDLKVTAGRGYRYRVTAVDGLGNESKPSAEVRETASAQ
jgi:fibronectin type 3 domain-containing protein